MTPPTCTQTTNLLVNGMKKLLTRMKPLLHLRSTSRRNEKISIPLLLVLERIVLGRNVVMDPLIGDLSTRETPWLRLMMEINMCGAKTMLPTKVNLLIIPECKFWHPITIKLFWPRRIIRPRLGRTSRKIGRLSLTNAKRLSKLPPITIPMLRSVERMEILH